MARRSRGVDALGQNLLMMAGLILALALAIVPAALAAGLAGATLRAVLGFIPILAIAAVAAVVMVFQNALVVEVLGGVLDKMDVSAIDPAE
jgi:predicted CDP-diglyceride synthetase/phosphatidate cytidylyltransferase